MGVGQLETFILNNVPNGTKTVSIKEECESFQRETGNRPTLVIDLLGLMKTISKDKVVELCGGRHVQFCKTLEDIFGRLSTIAKLVFFEDGPAPAEKLDECNRRRNDKYESSLIVIDEVYSGSKLSSIVKSMAADLPWAPTFLNMLEEMAKKYGTLFVAVTKECDTELARYACDDPSTLAVVADDSDFLIFAGNWRYFSFKNLNFEDLTTLEFNRRALRQHLGLTSDQMKTLSTIAGNDIVSHHDVQRFHATIGCPYKASEKFPFLARFVRDSLPGERNELVKAIAENIFRSRLKVWKDRVEDSLDLYKTAYQVKDYRVSNPILHFCTTKHLNFCYKVLKDLPDTLSLVYYDMREEPNDSFVESTLELLTKQIGILLQHNRRRPGGIHFTINAKRSHRDKYDKHYVSPLYPEQEVPTLMEFLNRQDHPEHDELRFSLLKWMVSEELLAPHDLSVVPKKYLLDVITLCFMVNKGLLTVAEADLILYTIKNVECGLIPDKYEPPDVVDPRAFKLSFLFAQVTINIQECFEVVGLKDTSSMKNFNFDGVFFHKAYLNHINNTEFNAADKLADIEQYRLYK